MINNNNSPNQLIIINLKIIIVKLFQLKKKEVNPYFKNLQADFLPLFQAKHGK